MIKEILQILYVSKITSFYKGGLMYTIKFTLVHVNGG